MFWKMKNSQAPTPPIMFGNTNFLIPYQKIKSFAYNNYIYIYIFVIKKMSALILEQKFLLVCELPKNYTSKPNEAYTVFE